MLTPPPHRPAPEQRNGRRAATAVPRALGALVALTWASALVLGAASAGAQAAGTPVAASGWRPPVPLVVWERFDRPDAPWTAGHRGLDLAALPGDPVVAVEAGVVTFAGQVGGRPVITVDHGALESTYEPVRSQFSVGDSVRAGDTIGTVDAGGHCDGACLHVGIRRVGAAAGDPERYLDPWPLLTGAPLVLKQPQAWS